MYLEGVTSEYLDEQKGRELKKRLKGAMRRVVDGDNDFDEDESAE